MTKPKLSLNLKTIVSKDTSQKTELLDSLRILGWKTFKRDKYPHLANRGQMTMLDVYKEHFMPEWEEDFNQLNQLSYKDLVDFLSESGYSEEELLMLRAEHYEQKKEAAKAYKDRNSSSSAPSPSDEPTDLGSVPF